MQDNKSAVQNAQSFLQMDMANLSNRQQTGMFGAQQQIQSLFTDQALKMLQDSSMQHHKIKLTNSLLT